MKLHYREYGEGDPVIILHGLFGSSENWHTISRGLSDHYRVIPVDQRNHGASPWAAGMDYPSMAADVLELLDRLSLERAFLVGHSMGGKTAMETALSFPERIRGLVVVDIAPIAYPPRHREMLEALEDLDPGKLTKRSEADAMMAGRIPDRMLRLFLLKNLTRNDEGTFRWRINLPAIVADFSSIWAAIDGGRVYDGPTLFIGGGNGGYLSEADHPAVTERFPGARMITFENAGHWVHADEPERFTKTVGDFFASL